jgi:hypothetical protein
MAETLTISVHIKLSLFLYHFHKRNNSVAKPIVYSMINDTLMNQMPISEYYLPKFNIQPHYHWLIVYIHKVR